MGWPKDGLLRVGVPWSCLWSRRSLTLAALCLEAWLVESCQRAAAFTPDFDHAFPGTVDVFFHHSQDNLLGGLSTERSIRPHESNEALPNDRNPSAPVALQTGTPSPSIVDGNASVEVERSVRSSTGGTGDAPSSGTSTKGTSKRGDEKEADETSRSSVRHPRPTTRSSVRRETPKAGGIKAAAPFKRSVNGGPPSRRSGNGGAPSERAVNGGLPSKRAVNDRLPSERAVNGGVPSKRSVNDRLPSKRSVSKTHSGGTQAESGPTDDELSKLFGDEAGDAAPQSEEDSFRTDTDPSEGHEDLGDLTEDSSDPGGPSKSPDAMDWTFAPDDPDWKFGLAPERKQGDKNDAEALTRRREERSLRGAQERKEEATLESLYNRAKTVCPGVNYLGIGYDSVKANPLGDPNLMGDPGLRSPIIRFHYRQDENGVTSDLTGLQPLGAYCRPFVACKQSENLSEVATLSDYVSELEVDASLGGGDSLGLYSFSASAGYRDQAKKAMAKKTRTFMLKTYCLRYEAGVAQTSTFNWNYTVAFSDALGFLPDTFEGSKNDEGCSPGLWRENRHDELCEKTNVRKWMDFIDQFGTHYTVRLFAGGKMTHQITMKNTDIAAMRSSGVDIKSSLKARFAVASVNASVGVKTNRAEKSQMKEYNYETETLIMGGRVPQDVSDPESMAEWSDSVEELPMPVKLTLQPLEKLIPPDRREAFKLATAFYSESIGMSKSEMSAVEGKPESIGRLLRKASQVVYAGEPPGFAMCPEHKRVVLGFALQLNFMTREGKISAAIKPCTPGRDKCDGVEREKVHGDEARIFVLCGDEPVPGLEQVVVNTHTQKAVAVCPEGTLIATGFTLSLAGGRHGPESTNFLPCRAGLTTCTGVGSNTSEQNLAWIVCVDEKTTGLDMVVNVGIVSDAGPASRTKPEHDGKAKAACPARLGAALGFADELHSRMADVRDRFKECTDWAKLCTVSGKGVDQAGFLKKHDSHALVAFLMCAETKKSESATTHTEKQTTS